MLALCVAKHTCPDIVRTPFPSRILTLRQIETGEIQVKVTENSNKHGKYAALSHCWGQQLSCITTRKNLQERKCGISWTELPATFRDAIIFCLRLNIYHLWIDALCIIQDDERDWQIESSRMADIYQNSYLTLAATSSNSDSSGFLPTEAVTAFDTSWDALDANAKAYQLRVRHVLQHWEVPQTTLLRGSYPLLLRGWAFQERILAPRVLHFCKQELVWECGEGARCECGSLPQTRNLKRQFALAAKLGAGENHDNLSLNVRPPRMLSIPHYSRIKKIDAIVQWHGIVEEFSGLQLSNEKDCFPALSGLAERMGLYLGTYIAGLWDSKWLLSDLTWRVEKLQPETSRPAKYRGPTWSWVSVKTRVVYNTKVEGFGRLEERLLNSRNSRPSRDYRGDQAYRYFQDQANRRIIEGNPRKATHAASVIEYKVNTEENNKYGQVSSAILVMSGVLRECRLLNDRVLFPNEPVPIFEIEVPNLNPRRGLATSLIMQFYADYVLDRGGPHKVSTSVVFLFALSKNVGLVLLKTPLQLRNNSGLRRQGASVFQRIGILRLPLGFEEAYEIDLTESERATIVAII
ncbi:HET-domain-containing protein [Nemania diffusa]|nr:HET-domain-containing protein [Nemania diffusa]